MSFTFVDRWTYSIVWSKVMRSFLHPVCQWYYQWHAQACVQTQFLFSSKAPCTFPPKTKKRKLFDHAEVKLTGCFYNMTDVFKYRQRTAWRAWWLWRWLYMLNDIQQMKGKCDWTAFPPGLNIKASPTGNILNLPRLPPQWGTLSTMRKNGPSARGLYCRQINTHVHKQKCALVNPKVCAHTHIPK